MHAKVAVNASCLPRRVTIWPLSSMSACCLELCSFQIRNVGDVVSQQPTFVYIYVVVKQLPAALYRTQANLANRTRLLFSRTHALRASNVNRNARTHRVGERNALDVNALGSAWLCGLDGIHQGAEVITNLVGAE